MSVDVGVSVGSGEGVLVGVKVGLGVKVTVGSSVAVAGSTVIGVRVASLVGSAVGGGGAPNDAQAVSAAARCSATTERLKRISVDAGTKDIPSFDAGFGVSDICQAAVAL